MNGGCVVANRTGRGVNVPQGRAGRVAIQANVPAVNVSELSPTSPAGAEAASLMAQVLGGVSRRVEDRRDIQAAAEATKEGRAAGLSGVPQLRDETTIRGAAFNQSAIDAVRTDFDLKARVKLDELEREYEFDPVGFEQQSQAFIQGHLSSLTEGGYLEIAQDIGASFEVNKLNARNRIDGRHKARLRDEQLENALRSQIKLQDDIQTMAMQLFTADAAEVPALLDGLTGASARLTDTATQIGPDGTPLFSARERVAFEQNAKDVTGEAIGLAYMQSQPDILSGFRAFQNGDAAIDVEYEGQFGRVLLDEILPPDVKLSVQKKYMDLVRSELSLQSQIEAAQDRAFNDRSDALFSDLSVAAQDGVLTPDMVEASKSFLEPDKYTALRALAKTGGATVTDGNIYRRLLIEDAAGNDIRDDLVASSRSISTEDFARLYQQNSNRLNEGVTNPVQSGRDYLAKGLGALSTEIGLAQAVSIGDANAEYTLEIEKFVAENERQPTHSEARDIAEKTRIRFSAIDARDSLFTLPLPASMTQAERLSRDLTAQSVVEKAKMVRKQYLEKFSGDAQARDSDPDYLREMRLLKRYFDILQAKEVTGGQ